MSTHHQDAKPPPAPEPLGLKTTTVILVGSAVWGLLLVLSLLVPSLHEGERSWWPWTCVVGLALGTFGYWYVRRGRGNAVDVDVDG